MKKIVIALAALLISTSAATTKAFDFGSLIGGIGDLVNSDVIGNVIDGVFTTANLEVKDLAGEWKTTGSAVSFQSESLLNKAGGVAGAAMIESKLDPYFKKYGLTGATFTIQTDGSFQMKVKKITINGTITKQPDGNFTFHFKALGSMNLGSVTAYVTKSPSNMSVMFDASKLQSIMSGIASITNNQIAQTASSLLNSYDGICVGFKMKKSGTVPGENSQTQSGFSLPFTGGSNNGSTQQTSQPTQTTKGAVPAPDNTQTPDAQNVTPTNDNSGNHNQQVSPADAAGMLFNLFNKRK